MMPKQYYRMNLSASTVTVSSAGKPRAQRLDVSLEAVVLLVLLLTATETLKRSLVSVNNSFRHDPYRHGWGSRLHAEREAYQAWRAREAETAAACSHHRHWTTASVGAAMLARLYCIEGQSTCPHLWGISCCPITLLQTLRGRDRGHRGASSEPFVCPDSQVWEGGRGAAEAVRKAVMKQQCAEGK